MNVYIHIILYTFIGIVIVNALNTLNALNALNALNDLNALNALGNYELNSRFIFITSIFSAGGTAKNSLRILPSSRNRTV